MLAPIDIAGGQVSGVDDLGSAASTVVNWEADESGVVRPRPPLVTHTLSNVTATTVIGSVVWSTYLVTVTDNRYVWSVSQALPEVGEARSTATTTTQVEGDLRVTFALGDSYVYMAGGGQIQRWGPSLATSEVLSSSPRCTHVAALSNYLVANDIDNPDQFKWSDIGEGDWTTWPAANFNTADARPDPIVGIFENTNELFVFGQQTLQVYAPGADPLLPFEVASTINTGLGAPYAFTRLDEQVVFLDDKRRVVIGDGRSNAPISDAIQKDLRDLTTISDCWMYREERGQHSSLVVRFPTEGRTFVYSLKSQRWSERQKYTAPFQGDWPVNTYSYWPARDYHMFGSTVSGFYRFGTSGQELSAPLVCERTTGWSDFGTPNKKRSARIQATMRRGTAAEGATPGAFELRKQDDDGPWSDWTQLSVGTPSDYRQTMFAYVGGVFRRRRYGMRYSNTEDFSLVSMHDDVTDLEAQE
jgi:hypothetical protein